MKRKERLLMLMDAVEKHIQIVSDNRHCLDYETSCKSINSRTAFNTMKGTHFNHLNQKQRKKFLLFAEACNMRIFGEPRTIDEHVYWRMNVSPVFEHFDGEPLWDFEDGEVRDYGTVPVEFAKQMEGKSFDEQYKDLERWDGRK